MNKHEAKCSLLIVQLNILGPCCHFVIITLTRNVCSKIENLRLGLLLICSKFLSKNKPHVTKLFLQKECIIHKQFLSYTKIGREFVSSFKDIDKN